MTVRRRYWLPCGREITCQLVGTLFVRELRSCLQKSGTWPHELCLQNNHTNDEAADGLGSFITARCTNSPNHVDIDLSINWLTAKGTWRIFEATTELASQCSSEDGHLSSLGVTCNVLPEPQNLLDQATSESLAGLHSS